MIERLRVQILAGAVGEFSSLESTLCADSYLVSIPPLYYCTVLARKRSLSFCQKWRWQVTPKHAYTFWPNRVGMGWFCCCPGIVWEPVRKQAHTQLVREHLVTVITACWANVDWSWPEEWNSVRKLIFTKKKKKSTGREWIVKHSPKILAHMEKATTTICIVFLQWQLLIL